MDVVVECYGGEPNGNASTFEQCTIETQQELLTLARDELNNERDTRIRDMNMLNMTLSSGLRGLVLRSESHPFG